MGSLEDTMMLAYENKNYLTMFAGRHFSGTS